ncbi:hypothetical protein DEIPH_ctg017orf0229 [Deinococcus phoenicis]|uniref:Uncharacterized protein n=1 Tax=Deinococcus phoenicis TaxID=1476583 RepID=A0A016QS82_9DEIO|nr:hypothetical protein [Deinococcus phoenicis]EYB68851.1 hypothetical protein DEIPH_ctg017orf0229 [Deinococcus phoenicis]
MQRFILIRHEDVSGSSGTGAVAEGVVFSDGTAAMRWLVEPCSTALYSSIGDVERIHGHEGRTVVQVLDQVLPMPVLAVR